MKFTFAVRLQFVAFGVLFCSVTPQQSCMHYHDDAINCWHERWLLGMTNFHAEAVNPVLLLYEDYLLPFAENNERVFFPLCGKSVDMPYLALKKHMVVGIEVVRSAIDSFCNEQGADITNTRAKREFSQHTIRIGPEAISNIGPGMSWQNLKDAHNFEVRTGRPMKSSTKMIIVEGDFLQSGISILGKFSAVFDRGGIVSVPPEHHPAYAKLMGSVLLSGARILLVVVEHDCRFENGTATGPPFSITQNDVHEIFGEDFGIKQLKTEDMIHVGNAACSSSRSSDCVYFRQVVYLLVKDSSEATIEIHADARSDFI